MPAKTRNSPPAKRAAFPPEYARPWDRSVAALFDDQGTATFHPVQRVLGQHHIARLLERLARLFRAQDGRRTIASPAMVARAPYDNPTKRDNSSLSVGARNSAARFPQTYSGQS